MYESAPRSGWAALPECQKNLPGDRLRLRQKSGSPGFSFIYGRNPQAAGLRICVGEELFCMRILKTFSGYMILMNEAR